MHVVWQIGETFSACSRGCNLARGRTQGLWRQNEASLEESEWGSPLPVGVACGQ